MNAARNHFTSKLLVTLGALVCAQSIWAQSLWELGSNVAGEALGVEIGQQAEASIGGEFTSGEFRTPSMGKTLWSAKAQAEAVSAYQDLYLKGNFGFELTYGTQMMGSMFTEPGYFPVDVLEFTPGNKLRQTYDIGGGFAWKNSSRWTPGAELRFRGINYAKRKDLRHTTYRQEFEVSPSVVYSGDGWMAGATYSFGKTSEFITASVDGIDNAQTYMAFLDKGMRYGTMQAWDGVGVHLTGDGVDRFPVKEFSNSIALQGSIGSFLYADVQYTHTEGEVGEKGYTWFHFPGNAVEAKAVGIIPGKNVTHMIGCHYSWSGMDNYGVVIDKVATGGVVTPVRYGENRIFRNRHMSFGTAYAMRHHRGWMLGVETTFENNRDLMTIMYPFYDIDHAWHMYVTVMGAFSVKKFDFDFGCTGINLIGSHSEYWDMGATYRLKDWWDLEQEISDAPRCILNASVRYNIGIGLFAEAGITWTHAFEIELLGGKNRQTTFIKFGYNF